MGFEHTQKEPSSPHKKTQILQTLKWITQTQLGITVISVVLSLCFLALLVVIFGSNPVVVISAMVEGALRGKSALVATIEEMAVLILTGLAVLIPIKGGYFNIGCQGQLEMGALAAAVLANLIPGPPVVVMLGSMLGALVVGVLVGAIPLALRVKRGASEVTSAIMLNYCCTYFCRAMFYGPFKDPAAEYGTTVPVAMEVRLPYLFNLHIGVYMAVVLAVLAYFLMNRTVFGTQLYATGYNRRAALAAGIPVGKVFSVAVLLGAAIGGLSGGMQVMGVVHRVAQDWALNWGFIGVCIAFLGGNALGIIPIAFLLSFISTGGRFMQAMTGVPEALVSVMQGLPVVIFLIFSAVKLNSTLVNIRDIWNPVQKVR